jgi:hypothetical protein
LTKFYFVRRDGSASVVVYDERSRSDGPVDAASAPAWLRGAAPGAYDVNGRRVKGLIEDVDSDWTSNPPKES